MISASLIAYADPSIPHIHGMAAILADSQAFARAVRGAKMTFIVGIRTEAGVVIASDSCATYSPDTAWLHRDLDCKKLFQVDSHIVAASGRIEIVESAIKRIGSAKFTNGSELLKRIKDDVYGQYSSQGLFAVSGNASSLAIIVAGREESGYAMFMIDSGDHFFISEHASANKRYAPVGVNYFLGQMGERMSSPKMTLKAAAALGFYLVDETKRTDPSKVDGAIRVVKIDENGFSVLPNDHLEKGADEIRSRLLSVCENLGAVNP